MKNVESICKKVIALTHEEIAEAQEVASGQLAYMHPLKTGTQMQQHKLGRHNNAVLEDLRALKATLEAFQDEPVEETQYQRSMLNAVNNLRQFVDTAGEEHTFLVQSIVLLLQERRRSDDAANIETLRKATQWEELGQKIAACYSTPEGEDLPEEEGSDLITIGELAASAFGYLG